MLRHDLIDIDARITRVCNTANERLIGRIFALVSRLGDGVFWYTLLIIMPLLNGRWGATLAMAVTGLCATWTYQAVKAISKRERPCEREALHVTVAPLDRFSFPSGHTLHAVCFTVMATAIEPALGWLLIPFTVLVALSRLVLGLHYPSDVLVGGAIGAGIGMLGLRLSGLA